MPNVLRYAAFTDDPDGGNPAGVVLDASGIGAEEMQAIAAELGYSESAFLTPESGDEYTIRYYSPLAEVAFCGHATVAAAVALGREAELLFHTRGGAVPVKAGGGSATLTSVQPSVAPLTEPDLDELLAALGWTRDDLDPELPPRVAYAGVHHPILAVATR